MYRSKSNLERTKVFSVINSESHVNANVVKQLASPVIAVGLGMPHTMLAFPEERHSVSLFWIATVDLFRWHWPCLMKALSFSFPSCLLRDHLWSWVRRLFIIWCDRNHHGVKYEVGVLLSYSSDWHSIGKLSSCQAVERIVHSLGSNL